MIANQRAAMRLKGELTILSLSVTLAAVAAYLLSILVNVSEWPQAPAAFILFGAMTTLLLGPWIRADAAKAYNAALRQHYLGLEGTPPRIVSIANDCPSRWLVLLHIQLHPELTEPELPSE